nr:DUF3180 domain-containing protein [Galbitalea soli]
MRSTGQPLLLPPFTLAIALVVIGALSLGLAIPIRRAVKAKELRRIDPFYATRVVVFAKSSSIAGALLLGMAGAILVFLLTLPVTPAVSSILMASATLGGAVVLLVTGLVAEFMCSIPPDDHDQGDERPATAHPH